MCVCVCVCAASPINKSTRRIFLIKNFLLNQTSGFYYFHWNIIQSNWISFSTKLSNPENL